MNKTYALAIRKLSNTYDSPVIIVKRGLSYQEAITSADRCNRLHMPECRALGGECFVAYNMQAQ